MEQEQVPDAASNKLIDTSSSNMSADSPAKRSSRHTKRLTLNFPILSPTIASDRYDSPSSTYSTPAQSGPNSPSRLEHSVPSPVDSTGFLTSIAAQERKVLELKEELQRAENELEQLKKQWAQYEATKKRSEIRHVERLQPVPKPTDGSLEEDVPRRVQQLKRLERPVKKSQQRVFEGSRHARTLSLLSPTTLGERYAERPSIDKVASPEISEDRNRTSSDQPEEATPLDIVNTTFSKTYKDLANRRSLPPASREVLVKTGKQMASDLKEGFWTFVEDIRQATVGEEGINATDNRTLRMLQSQADRSNLKQSGANAPKRKKSRDQLGRLSSLDRQMSSASKSSSKSVDKDDSFWKEFGLETPEQKRIAKQPSNNAKASTIMNDLLDQDDHWDLWDSPVVPSTSKNVATEGPKHNLRHSNSTIGSHSTADTNLKSGTSSHRSSTSSVEVSSGPPGRAQQQQPPAGGDQSTVDQDSSDNATFRWSKTFSPSRLSRTISDMMKEFEIEGPSTEETIAAAVAQKAMGTDQETESTTTTTKDGQLNRSDSISSTSERIL